MYATCINNAMKWFPGQTRPVVGPDRGGRYGSGTILTVIPISKMIASAGYQSTFFTFGLIQGVVIVLFASFLRGPIAGAISIPQTSCSRAAITRSRKRPAHRCSG